MLSKLRLVQARSKKQLSSRMDPRTCITSCLDAGYAGFVFVWCTHRVTGQATKNCFFGNERESGDEEGVVLLVSCVVSHINAWIQSSIIYLA